MPPCTFLDVTDVHSVSCNTQLLHILFYLFIYYARPSTIASVFGYSLTLRSQFIELKEKEKFGLNEVIFNCVIELEEKEKFGLNEGNFTSTTRPTPLLYC